MLGIRRVNRMLYQAIRRGSEHYHCDTNLSSSNEAYRKLLCCDMDQSKWQNPLTLDEDEVEKVRKFVAGRWKTRNMQAKSEHLLPVLEKVMPKLNKLRGKTILDVCLDEEKVGESIAVIVCSSFKRIANCGPPNRRNNRPNNETTAASKILHIINPELFVPWDGAITRGYGGYNRRLFYTDFLRRMQMLANYAIEQVKRECDVSRDVAIERLQCDGHTLAKTLDEYNYVKFTLNEDSVWQAEYEPCNSP